MAIRRKAQIAIEFLTTYSWVLVALLILLAVLIYYSGFNPLGFVPRQCAFEPGLPCTSYKLEVNQITGTTRLIIQLSNELGYDIALPEGALLIRVENIGKPGKNTYLGNCSPKLPYVIKKGASFTCIVEITDKEVIPPAGKIVKLDASLNYKNCLTDPNYLATGNCTAASNYTSSGTAVTLVEGYSLTLYCGDGVCSASIGENPSTCPADCPPPASIILTANPTLVAPDGVSYSTITATVRGVNGLPMQNIEVVFTTNPVGKLDKYTTVTNAAGQATVRITSESPGVATVMGVVPPISNKTSVMFYYVPSTILLTHSPAEPCSNTTHITATVLDQKGNRIKDLDVLFSHNATGVASFSPQHAFTNEAGEASTEFSDTKLHMERVRVNATVQAPDIGITLRNSTVLDYTPYSIFLSNSRFPPLCGKNFRINAHVKDRYGNPICGYPVYFYHNATGNAALTPTLDITNSSGNATTVLSDDRVEDIAVNGTIILESGERINNYTTAQYGAPIFLSGNILIDSEITCEDVELHIVDGWLNISEGGKLTLKGVNLTFDLTPNRPGVPSFGIYLQGKLYVTDSNGVRSNFTVNTTMEDCCAGEPACCALPQRPPDCDAGDQYPCYRCIVNCNYGQPRFVFEAFKGSTLVMNNTDLKYMGTYGVGVYFPYEVGLYVASDNAVIRNTTISNERDYCIILHGNNIQVINNTFSNCLVGVFIWQHANRSLISQNNIHNCGRYGIQLDNYGENNVIQYNHIYNNGNGIFIRNSKTNNLIQFNTITNHPDYGVYCDAGTPPPDARLSNNNIVNNGVDCAGCPSCPFTEMSQCGVITKNTILTANLISSSTCIIFGRDSIVLDCNGHTIRWIGAGSGDTYGIYAEGRKDIVVKNCVVYNFSKSEIGFVNTNSSKIINTTVAGGMRNNVAGIYLLRSSYNLIHNTTSFDNSGHGILLDNNSNYNTISNNNVAGNPLGISIYGSSYNLITNNSYTERWIDVRGNPSSITGTAIILGDDYDFPIGCTGNSITNNNIYTTDPTFYGMGGVKVGSCNYTKVQYNRFNRATNPLFFPWPHSGHGVISSNFLNNSFDSPIKVYGTNFTIYNNTVIAPTRDAIGVNANSSSVYNNSLFGTPIGVGGYNVSVYQNIIRSAPTCLSISYENPMFSKIYNNTIYNCSLYGISIDGNSSKIYNNTLFNNSIGISVGNILTYNNSIYNNTLFNNSIGISAAVFSNQSIYENRIFNNTQGLYLGYNANLNIMRNIVQNNTYGCNCSGSTPTFVENTITLNMINCVGCPPSCG